MLPSPQQLRDDWGVCRVCASPDRKTILDLGDLPLANAFRRPSDEGAEPVFPLGLVWCPRCHIVQIPVTVDPDTLFREYVYTPSASTTWRRHCAQLSEWTRQRFGETDQPSSLSQPQTTAACFAKSSNGPQGVGDRADKNIAAQANANGIATLPEFFSLDLARGVRADYGPADVIIGTNVLAHVPDIIDFVRGAAHLLTNEGSLVIEAPYLLDLVDRLAYDTIYHEHVSYLSVIALDRIFQMAGLELVHVQRDPIHGGSIRFVGSRGSHERDPSVQQFLDEELDRGYGDGRALRGFAGRVEALRSDLHETVAALERFGYQDRRLWRNRQRKHPAFHQRTGPRKHPICGGQRFPEAGPADAGHPHSGRRSVGDRVRPGGRPAPPCVNLEEEVLEEQSDFRRRGGRFLIPVPSPRFAH